MGRLFYIHQKQTASFLAPLFVAFLSLAWAVPSSQAKPGSDQARFVAVGARRAANRVLHALKDAQAALGAALAS